MPHSRNLPNRETQNSRYLAVQIQMQVFKFSVSRGTDSNADLQIQMQNLNNKFVQICNEFEFLDFMDFGGVAISVESVIYI